MVAWVIKRIETKKYLNTGRYFDNLCGAILFRTKHFAEREINIYNYLDCKPVKVRIEEVEE